MASEGAKEIVYIYNSNEDSAEVEFDPDGKFPVPIDGSTIKRNGRVWKVARTGFQAGANDRMPILKIGLTDAF